MKKAGIFTMVLALAVYAGLGQAEIIKRDGNRNPVAAGVTDDATQDVRNLRVDPTSNRLLVDTAASGSTTITGSVDQGASGTSSDPWFINVRDASGTELGLAAAPFSVRIFDGSSTALGEAAAPFIVGGTDGFGIEKALRTDTDGRVALLFGVSLGDNITATGGLRTDTGGNNALHVVGHYWDGAGWDRIRGDETDGALVNLGSNNDVTVTSGTIDIGTFPDNEPINVAQVGGTAISTNAGTADAGTQRVIQARPSQVDGTVTLSDTTETTVIGAGGSGVFHDIETIVIGNLSNTNLRVQIRDATGGTVIIPVPAAGMGGGAVVPFPSALQQTTADNNWTAELSASPSGGTVDVTLIGRVR